jgi:hypothetical protein
MIKILTQKISQKELVKLCQAHFDTMVKFVVDIDRGLVALGGEMHADAEALLLEKGSKQQHLWGGNLYPWNEADHRLEYTSFINIRPMDENMGMEIMDESMQRSVKHLVESLVLSPEEIMESLK